MPHGHADSELPFAAHAATPHVHLSGGGQGDHGHGCGQIEPHYGRPVADEADGRFALPAGDHDHDAVYPPPAVDLNIATSDGGLMHAFVAIGAPFGDVADAVSCAPAVPGRAETGDFLSGRDVCLALRTLRI